ncbi:unnamed protein product [Vicia faba]|uniref:Putative plant transposon protein domain-containing protein n=1 Tax=Vicia faba TaxID=3906 RepID=A0AAV0Z9V3_VICFA|nr:unnamed protein product [Vicia faba]
MEDLLREAQVLLVLILHNIRPSSHTSAFTLDTPQLLYLIMLGRRIDVAQIIANEMRNVVESGKEFGAGTKTICPLVFPGLMMGLLIASRVQIPNMVHFKIKTKVNDMYVDKYCLEKKRREGQSGQTSSETLNYNDWDLRLRQDFTYTWDQNDSSHRVVMSLHDAIYKLKILPEV